MELERTTPRPSRAVISFGAVLFAVQDLVLLGYLSTIWVLVQRTGASARQASLNHHIYGCMALVVLGSLFARGLPDVPTWLRTAVYRLSITAVVLENYLMLRDVLPLIRPDNLDATLHAIDLQLFHVEPAVWLERFNTRPAVEYFAFFYFSYFGICFTFVLLMIFLMPRGPHTVEFAIGTILVYCIGQLGYLAVPASGPVVALADSYHGPIAGGFFWSCVMRTVQAGGAMKDVFPSLHTAGPTWFSLFALHCARQDRRFRWLARITVFFTANIIVSTMFLRWHYAIDVVAGAALAGCMALIAPHLSRWEEERRGRLGAECAFAVP